jgi:hypothetical protein
MAQNTPARALSRDMTVALSRSGDKGDSAPAAGVAPVCSSPALRLPQRAAAWRGSRFWALAEDSSDEEDDATPIRSTQGSPARPSQVTVGDFLSAAFAKPSAGSAEIHRGKRAAFAPGGRGPRRLSRSSVGERRRQPPSSPPCPGVSPPVAARVVPPVRVSVSLPVPAASSPPLPFSSPATAPDRDPDSPSGVVPTPAAHTGQRASLTSGTCAPCATTQAPLLLGRPLRPVHGPAALGIYGCGNRSVPHSL